MARVSVCTRVQMPSQALQHVHRQLGFCFYSTLGDLIQSLAPLTVSLSLYPRLFFCFFWVFVLFLFCFVFWGRRLSMVFFNCT